MKWKKELGGMRPYKPGRSIEEVMQDYGLTEVHKLASNENPYGCAPSVKEFIREGLLHPEIYPEGHAGGLRTKLANKHQVGEDFLLFGNGSDEIVSIISRSLLGPDTNTIMATPTFPQYAHNAKVEGAEVRELPLVEGQHDLDGFLKAIDENTSVIWVCNPNNPTGNIIPAGVLESFLAQVPDHILVVLDEAYFEYITEPSHVDSIQLIDKFPNILILRTFSKAYGLAAFRVGYAVGQPAIITELNKVRNPFNNNTLGTAVVEKALEDEQFIANCREMNHVQRERFKEFAEANDLDIFDSQANFVLIQVPADADEASEYLLQYGYIVRSGNALGTPGYVRVTVGSEEQNNGFFQAMSALISEKGRHPVK